VRIQEEGPTNGNKLVLGASLHPANVHARLEVLQKLEPIVGDVFADIGCGRGAFGRMLATRCKHVSMVDIQAENISSSRQLMADAHSVTVDFHCAPAESLPLSPESYDNAFLIEVLDHVSDVSICLKQVNRILKQNGHCYVCVPNRFFPFETHPVKFLGDYFNPRLFPFLPWVPPLHRRMATARVFTASRLKRLAAESGFRKSKIAYVMPPFETSGLVALRSLFRICGRSPLRILGVSIAAVLTK